MKKSVLGSLLACLALLFTGCQLSGSGDSDAGGASADADLLFVVDTYDPARDAAKDFEVTVAAAKRTGRRVLLEVGGKW